MLVIAGSNVQRVEARGLTAAHLAAIQGHAAVLDKLLMAGYDVDTLGSVAVLGGMYNSGSSALHLAARNGHLQVGALLRVGIQRRQIMLESWTHGRLALQSSSHHIVGHVMVLLS